MLPTTLGITPEPQSSLEILWVSQINNSPHIQCFVQSVHYLNTVTFLKGLQAKEMLATERLL